MPPRYKYWTILIDRRPTAFRAQTREELLPTLYQLKQKSSDAVLKWFSDGRVWESPEDAHAHRSRRLNDRHARGRKHDASHGGRRRAASSKPRELEPAPQTRPALTRRKVEPERG